MDQVDLLGLMEGNRNNKNDRKYNGNYVNDKKEGYGEFYWPDGRIYKGYWKDGKQDGKGIYKGSNKVQREGEWLDGKLVKWLN